MGQFYFLDENISRVSERERAILRKEISDLFFQSFKLDLMSSSVFGETSKLPPDYTLRSCFRSASKRVRGRHRKKMNMSHRWRHFPQQNFWRTTTKGRRWRVHWSTNPKLILAD